MIHTLKVYMHSVLVTYMRLVLRKFHKTLFYVICLGMSAMMLSSCGGSKNSSSMRQIEKHSKKNPVGDDGFPVAARSSESKKVRQAMEKQRKQQETAAKEAEKAQKDAITRHRALQTQETRDRMDQHLKESDKRYSNKKEFFLVRWFRPREDAEKIEKRRAKEVQKRMAATLKKAEKNNAERRISSVKTEERKFSRPDPKNEQHGGGGTYKEGSATGRVHPSDIQHGGGGSYAAGQSKKRLSASDFQQGGGGSYREGSSGKQQKASDFQQGGGGSYREGKSGKKPSGETNFFKKIFSRKSKT